MFLEIFWFLGALLSMAAMAMDMRFLGLMLRSHRALKWYCLALLIGPLSLAMYFWRRPSLRRQLMEAVWEIVGDGAIEKEVRLARLEGLRARAFIGPAIYEACKREMEKKS